MEKIRIRDPGWKKFAFGIQDKHPGSATLNLNQCSGSKEKAAESGSGSRIGAIFGAKGFLIFKKFTGKHPALQTKTNFF
jgi:hypothetical protein